MRTELTITELEAETVELLPARETLNIHFGHNWASIYANNNSTAFNVLTNDSNAYSNAQQYFHVEQN